MIKKMLSKLKPKVQNTTEIKEESEMHYWNHVKEKEGTLSNRHYEYFFTEYFGLDKSYYDNKRVMDIGCGPRGSLEWADNTKLRVGLDPLSGEYAKLGADEQDMAYVVSGSENIPFPDNYFDVVTSFNSIDHVEDLDATIAEISRVTRKGGLALILTDIHEEPTLCEPQIIDWDFPKHFKDTFEMTEEKHFEKLPDEGMYASLKKAVKFKHDDAEKRYGILSMKLVKRE